uniref:Uncharacterized protein n=1 Tax=Chromera velia CCMP2878 TaxID=1169474 RepID=A0A0G4GNW9_9ALVE|eukprot:Cvel_22723.t1-p1 / transcript=Cvel_22723.t1 / gene=Cvel_22723 / organism=Chromera_velia_CCMP2878 / gene_product=hypothetical protein / transcript_product=hypothetical protein / location=Cvel_scaffold2264:28067-29186(-) / protein_length=200 / sequence_SO=supercontig / SO=protein_coding / is_pseudo=false
MSEEHARKLLDPQVGWYLDAGDFFVSVMLVNPKSFKKSWVRFLLSFLLSLTEIVILALSFHGFNNVSSRMSRGALYFQVSSTLAVIAWKCTRVVATRFDLFRRCRKIDEFLERQPPEAVPSKKKRKEGRKEEECERTKSAVEKGEETRHAPQPRLLPPSYLTTRVAPSPFMLQVTKGPEGLRAGLCSDVPEGLSDSSRAL